MPRDTAAAGTTIALAFAAVCCLPALEGRPTQSSRAESVLKAVENQDYRRLVADIAAVVDATTQSVVVYPSTSVESAASLRRRDGRPAIIYNPAFMSRLETTAPPGWAVAFVFAHEVSHYRIGHPNASAARRDAVTTELQADELSGFILARLGASLSETKEAAGAAMSLIESLTPDRLTRLQVVEQGWRKRELIDSVSPRR